MRRAGFLLPLWLFCAHSQQPTPRERALTAVRDLGTLLQQLLAEEIRRGGFEGAAASCADSAQLVTEEFARERGLEIRRVSLKYRNAKDQPDEWEAARLRDWEKLAAAGKPPADIEQIVADSGRRFLRYMKPISVQALCLNCHGERDRIPDGVRAVLNDRYPRDKATGYKTGDLRGAFSVSVAIDR